MVMVQEIKTTKAVQLCFDNNGGFRQIRHVWTIWAQPKIHAKIEIEMWTINMPTDAKRQSTVPK